MRANWGPGHQGLFAWCSCAPECSLPYLEAEGLTRDLFPSLAQYRATALEMGLELVWMAGSTLAEWDHYEMQQTAAVDRFARAEPDHPDLAEIRERRRTADEIPTGIAMTIMSNIERALIKKVINSLLSISG